ncbi:DUF2235 domain-containing protein [Bradyrhizobium sp. WYCCWR 13022]|uniref:phospholipase effector Tle1 domain-containing protein n=1 Tax=unclassified Bradyrhizobium TaxID=2631580 RepID=UPI00263BBFD9|nr:DUF2235 domain-containing protein [Bradyrhizobium sp. WYCCWR 13022]MDN4985550.1 DUF2235 domain-containing protein [Bradyrhizobium sp. WYCCWR 13022]
MSDGLEDIEPAGRNIVIYSDGTGQAGGFRFDEARTNVYKMYRASRCGPDSAIDPRDQVAFYDPGLGSEADGVNIFGKALRWIHNTVAQATGFGITRNLIDCYAALIRLWRPGDRIFMIGFSRGAYTVRCLGGIVARCGIPTHAADDPGTPLKLDDASVRKLAAEAVKHVYQFTEPRKTDKATPRQKFLLDTRVRIARAFRRRYGSADAAAPENANVYPYFVGVFDTVAALGNLPTFLLFTCVFAGGVAVFAAVVQVLVAFLPADSFLAYFTFLNVFGGVIALAALTALVVYVYTHLKWDFTVEGYDRGDKLRTMHLNELWMQFYDTELSAQVSYARHAISIDENRKDFARVAWSSPRGAGKDGNGIQWFEQVWFAGDHADVGGGYPENESRLSDIALDWMTRWAAAVPHGLKFDRNLLRVWPHPDGPQHDEVAAGFDSIPRWTGFTWTEKHRDLPDGGLHGIIHESVYRRFDAEAVRLDDGYGAYRPVSLSRHDDFARFWAAGAAFPANSYDGQKNLAGEPPEFPAEESPTRDRPAV